MKQKFSNKWKASKQPRKQRKYSANAPIHRKKKLLSVNLSKDLRKKHGKRNMVVKKGDTVKIMKGKFKKKQGKILEIKIKQSKIIVDGIQVKKQDGSNVGVSLRPSNLQVIELDMSTRKAKTSDKSEKQPGEAKEMKDKKKTTKSTEKKKSEAKK